MHSTTFGHKNQIFWVTVGAVLFNGIAYILSCELIFQFKSNQWHSVEEKSHIKRKVSICFGIMQLANDTKAIFFVLFFCGIVQLRGKRAIHIEQVSIVPIPFT